jgi:histidinol-phosphate aminotransferase
VIGRPRPAVQSLPAYRPGKDAKQAEAEHGISDAIKLASNETPWGPVPSVIAAIEDAAPRINRYADHRASALRERLADWIGVGVDQVTAGCGSVGLLQQLLLSYVDPGDEVLYPWRSFEVYPVYTRLVGGTEVTVPLKDDRFDLPSVAAASTPRTKLVILSNPNNPTGTAQPMSEIRELLGAVHADCIVVVDEAYREFMSPGLGDPVTDLLPDHPNLVVLRTFSKAQGLAALRVGYAIAHPEVIETIDKTLFPFAVNGLAQVAAMAAIDAHTEVMERVGFIIDERSRISMALAEAGWRMPDPEANFVYLPLGSLTEEVYLEMERQGVVTRPFAGEGIRVTIGTAEENDRFLRTLIG